MSTTAMTAQMAIWLVAAVAATAAAQAAQFSRFNFPFSMLFMHSGAAWVFARAAVLVFNLQLDLGDLPTQQAPATKQDAGPSKQKQLMIAGLLLGGSMATQALVQGIETRSGAAAAVFKVSSNTRNQGCVNPYLFYCGQSHIILLGIRLIMLPSCLYMGPTPATP
jgi:hypothetical protein